MGRRGWFLGLLGVAVMALGCATPDGDAAGGSTASAPVPAPFGATVVGVHPGPDEYSLVMDIDVSTGAPDCVQNPRVANVIEENGYVHADVIYDSPAYDSGGCPNWETVTVTLTFDIPVAGKPLAINLRMWEPGTPDYRLCDENLGCQPPADHCDRAWIDEATSDQDLPQHSYVDTVYCDQSWLVLEINTNAGACGAGRPGCSAPPTTRRVFYGWDDRWVTIAGGREAGCPEALAAHPDFPMVVCADLPAPA